MLETASEHEDTAGNEKSKAGSITLDGSVGGGIWKFAQAQAELSGSGNLTLNSHSQTVLKEIATKTLHDAAFDIAYEQIHNEYDMDPQSADLGSYIELTQTFEFVDLGYIESLFSESGFISFLKKQKEKKLNSRSVRAFTKN